MDLTLLTGKDTVHKRVERHSQSGFHTYTKCQQAWPGCLEKVRSALARSCREGM